VLERPHEGPPRFHPRYQELAAHFGFTIKPCGVREPHEKGRVENGVGYVKKNFLNGRELGPFASINPAARQWLDTVANVRCHGETHQRPCDRFHDEKAQLLALPTHPFDSALIQPVRACAQCRVHFQANRYSVPAAYAGCRLILKVYPERVCLYRAEQLVARHRRVVWPWPDAWNPLPPSMSRRDELFRNLHAQRPGGYPQPAGHPRQRRRYRPRTHSCSPHHRARI